MKTQLGKRYGGWVICSVMLCMLALPVSAQMEPELFGAAIKKNNVPVSQAPQEVIVEKPVVVDLKLLSLFFSRGDRDIIAQARNQFLTKDSGAGSSEADLLDQLQGIKAAMKTEEDLPEKFAPQFYLESLIYHGPSDWLVWIKGSEISKKFSPVSLAASELGLKLVAVNKEDITLEWSPKNWARALEAGKKAASPIQLDTSRRLVIFTLRVNQTMTSGDMQIREGFVPPVPLEAVLSGGEKALPSAGQDAKNPKKTVENPVQKVTP